MPLKCYAQCEISGLDNGVSAGWLTAIRLTAPANVRPEIDSYGCDPQGTVNSDPPIKLRLIKASAAGSGGSAITVTKRSPGGSETPQISAQAGTFSAEPTTTGQPLDVKSTHPQQGFEEPAIHPGQWEILGGEVLLLQYNNEGGGAGIDAKFDIAWRE